MLIQHLDPTHGSALSGLLAKATKMPVKEVTDQMAVEPDHVYVIPPNTNMAIRDGVLTLTPRLHPPHLPIDFFFRALSGDRQEAAIGVILSGTGSDGTLGLAALKEAGGVTFAQEEQSAWYGGMPTAPLRRETWSSCFRPLRLPENCENRQPSLSNPPPRGGIRAGAPRKRAGTGPLALCTTAEVEFYLCNLRRSMPASPISPLPNRAMLAGSGTGFAPASPA